MDVHVAAPTQADDISLISPVRANIQAMVSLCQEYSAKWQFTFSPQKSNIIVFNTRKRLKCQVELYGKVIPEVDSTRHVGITLNAKFDNRERTRNASSKMKSTAMMLMGAGLHSKGLNPNTSANLIKSVCLPKALFGCELWTDITRGELTTLERAQRFCLKLCQGLPKTTRTDICTSLIG